MTAQAAEVAGRRRGRHRSPVVWWAAVGAGVVGLAIYLLVRWIASGDARPTSQGPDRAPTWMQVVGHTWEIGGLIACAWFIYAIVIRPWRRDGRISADGIFTIAFLSLIWQDVLLNYHHVWQTFNASLINFGSWGGGVPGWQSDRGSSVAEPLVWLWPTYAYLMFGAVIFTCTVFTRAQQRWPHVGLPVIAVGYVVIFAVVDALGETVVTALGIYAYPGANPSLTLWHGHYFQVPVYMSVLFGTTVVVWSLLRMSRDAEGLTFVERGTRRTVVRILAVIGVVNLIYFCFLEAPIQLFHMDEHSWPDSVVEHRSYLLNEVCGPGTPVRCP